MLQFTHADTYDEAAAQYARLNGWHSLQKKQANWLRLR